MSDPVALALVAIIPTVVTAIFGFLNNAIARRAEERSVKNEGNLQQMVKHTDGMKDALVKLTGESEYAKGLKAGEESK